MRKIVREKATAIIKERLIEVSAAQSLCGTALQGRLSEAPLGHSFSSAIQDK
jgi:hypothetical protein